MWSCCDLPKFVIGVSFLPARVKIVNKIAVPRTAGKTRLSTSGMLLLELLRNKMLLYHHHHRANEERLDNEHDSIWKHAAVRLLAWKGPSRRTAEECPSSGLSSCIFTLPGQTALLPVRKSQAQSIFQGPS